MPHTKKSTHETSMRPWRGRCATTGLTLQEFEERVDHADVQPWIKRAAVSICRSYGISGLCDPAYIANVIAGAAKEPLGPDWEIMDDNWPEGYYLTSKSGNIWLARVSQDKEIAFLYRVGILEQDGLSCRIIRGDGCPDMSLSWDVIVNHKDADWLAPIEKRLMD